MQAILFGSNEEKIISSGNFITSTKIKDELIKDYSNIIKKKFDNQNKSIKNKLPFIYWIPKFHKTPIDSRFITSGRNTVINLLSKYIGIGLKHLLQLEKHQCNFKHKFSNIKSFYIIEDNKELINYMNINNSV